VILRVYGTRYKCVLRYTSVAALDPLAEFVRGVVAKSGRGQRIERLIKSFGLSSRIVEEVLADLVRSNAVRLDLSSLRVIPSAPTAALTSAVYDDRGILDLWQDHSSGAILPASWIGPYSREVPGFASLPALSYDDFPGFLDAADAHLISFLVRAEPALRYASGGEWRLDRLVHRTQQGSQSAFFPVKVVSVGDQESMYVEAPGIPAWVTRAWTAAFLRSTASRARVFIGAAAASSDGLDGVQLNPLQHTQLQLHVGRWAESAREQFASIPPPRSLHDMRGFEQLQGVLQERLLSLAFVELRQGDETNLRYAVRTAKRSILFVLSTVTEPLLEQLCDAVRGLRDKLDVQILHAATEYASGTESAEHVAEMLREAGIVTVPLGRIPGNCVLIDGDTVVLAATTVLTSNAPAFVLRGHDVGASVLGLVQSLGIGAQRFSWAARDDRSGADGALSSARFGGEDGSPVKEVLGELRELRRQMIMAMHERRLEDRSESDASRSQSITTDGRAKSENETPRIALNESHPSLVRFFESILGKLKARLSEGYSPFTYVDGSEQHEVLRWFLAETPGSDDHLRIFSEIGEKIDVEAVYESFRNLAASGWRITVFHPDDDVTIKRARLLRESMPDLGIVFQGIGRPLACGMVSANDLLICGTYHVLRDCAVSDVRGTFLVAFQSASARAAILDTLGASETT
jgi:hypothetical protein